MLYIYTMVKTLKKKQYRKKSYRNKAKKQTKRKTHRKRGGGPKRKREHEYEDENIRNPEYVREENTEKIIEKIEEKIEEYKTKVENASFSGSRYDDKNVDELEEEIEQHENDDAQWFDAQRGNPTPEEMKDIIVLKLLVELLDGYNMNEFTDDQLETYGVDIHGNSVGPTMFENKMKIIKNTKDQLKKYSIII